MYDEFSADYDRFVNWPGRLAAEIEFLERQLEKVGAQRVLDAACGTGMHAVVLAQQGYESAGADLSPEMVARARENAARAGVDVRFEAVGFGELHAEFGTGFDAVLCLGNSLPHVLTPQDLTAAMDDFAACLRPGGLLLIQNRNFDRVLQNRERWMEPQTHREGEREWVFLRFYDYEPDDRIVFNVVTLRRREEGWDQQVVSTRLWPLRQRELVDAVEAAGLGSVSCWGDMQGMPFDAESSPNLVLTAVLSP